MNILRVDVCSGISIDVLAAVCLPSSRVRINSETKLNQSYAHLIVIPTSIKAFNFAECLSFTLAENVSGVIPDCYMLLFALELYGEGPPTEKQTRWCCYTYPAMGG
jgi:hypothetical protein